MSDDVFEKLHEALNVAREGGFRTVESLRAALYELHPNHKPLVDEALLAWARHSARALEA